jgi:hypothetical protein
MTVYINATAPQTIHVTVGGGLPVGALHLWSTQPVRSGFAPDGNRQPACACAQGASRCSQQRAELLRGHADDGKDVSQRALGHVPARVDRDRNGTAIGVLHHVMAASNPCGHETGAFERLDYLRSRYSRDAARHKPGNYQISGYAERQSQLIRWPDHLKQGLKRGAQVGDRFFWRRTIADRPDTRPELGRGAPNAVLILLDGVGHVNDTSHETNYSTFLTAVRSWRCSLASSGS